MPEIEFLNIFQGIATMVASDPHIAVARVVLIALGIAFVYWGVKGTLEPLIIKMPWESEWRSSMPAFSFSRREPWERSSSIRLRAGRKKLLDVLQIDFLQPILVFTFSNGLIAAWSSRGSGQSRISVVC